jgi:hypothetical protein
VTCRRGRQVPSSPLAASTARCSGAPLPRPSRGSESCPLRGSQAGCPRPGRLCQVTLRRAGDSRNGCSAPARWPCTPFRAGRRGAPTTHAARRRRPTRRVLAGVFDRHEVLLGAHGQEWRIVCADVDDRRRGRAPLRASMQRAPEEGLDGGSERPVVRPHQIEWGGPRRDGSCARAYARHRLLSRRSEAPGRTPSSRR